MDINDVRLHCHLGEIIKKKNISALKLSTEIKYRRSTINDLINNVDMENKRIPAELIAKLCAYFNITPNELFSVIQKDGSRSE
ncbi:helix-turn-helix domain-containing protein [Paenibacillus ehimensis]|uniref:Helix-turn-helix transcriptional regulator n=1 Tax=Paenibacillus ehimensis TaxID=79264 RepID=A0ABT8V6D7_9BACL|nr:helix-turn-helix transcriptional regulator [Paenibacillus ehimensis]MDO3675545.1 helix-turn-helix transcriptional regulator [Paenibacillus ehimensis]